MLEKYLYHVIFKPDSNLTF